jgi:ABC-type transport system involved in multi-copper enzyme maturation permease subunit
VAVVLALPLVLVDDGTAKGLTQIVLTYTLSAITVLLGFVTLWLSCGSLARDVSECQIQMVCVKPVARWQVWLGKWLGILALDAVLLAFSGGAVCLLLQWRSHRLSADQQEILRTEIFVARAAARERVPDLTPAIERLGALWRKEHPQATNLTAEEKQLVNNAINARARAEVEEVPSALGKAWDISLGSLPERSRRRPMQIRFKFDTGDSASNPGATYHVLWRVGPSDSKEARVFDDEYPAGAFQEITVASPVLDSAGHLLVQCYNANNASLMFPMEDGFEVLYHESTFGVNFARGLAVILCWLAMLSAIGLASASFLSFPVAAFCSLAVLLVGVSTGVLSRVQEQKSIFEYSGDPPGPARALVDKIAVPVFGAVLKVVNLAASFSPVESLSGGLSITWPQLARAAGQIVLVMGGFFCVAGILLFYRRELAAAQSNS